MQKLVCWVVIGLLAVASPTVVQAQASAGPPPVADGAPGSDSAPQKPATDQETGKASDSEGVAAWVVSQGKTFTYRIAASIDALVVGYLYTGSLWGGGGIALFNAVVSSALYDLHEMAWEDFGPDPQTDPAGIALTKTITYRIVSIANVLATGLLFTGNFWLSSGLALGNAVIDSTIYFFHELAWSTWGPTIKKDLPAEANAAHKT